MQQCWEVGTFEKYLGHEASTLITRLLALQKGLTGLGLLSFALLPCEDTFVSAGPSASAMQGHSKNALPGASTLTLDFQASSTLRK
jgi:hypothetical protein